MSYINNMSPRRMIWFNQNAPKNKMDLWLSYNRHMSDNEDTLDETETTDNANQRDCDLIMKVWDCGDWKPIVGFNTTSANKINTVSGKTYTYTYNGTSHTSTGYTGFHLPLFRDDDASPYELFDAGTIGSALETFVSESEWQSIIENGGLGNAISNSHEHIDLWPAESNRLGGIWADMFSNSTHADTSTANKTYFA